MSVFNCQFWSDIELVVISKILLMFLKPCVRC